MEFFDFLYSKEGELWYNMGVPDVHRVLVNGKWEFKPDVNAKLNDPTAKNYKARTGIQQYILPLYCYIDYEAYKKPLIGPNMNYTQEQYDAWKSHAYWPKFISQVIAPMATEEEMEALDKIGGDVYTYIDEEIAKFIVGERDLAEWDEFLKQCYDLGIEEILKIKQQQVDRLRSN